MLSTLLLLAASVCGVAAAANIELRLVDETGRPIWARLEVYGPDGKFHQPAGAVLDPRSKGKEEAGYRSSFIVHGVCKLDVPAGVYKVIAEHGAEYERWETSVAAGEAGSSHTIQMKPWIRARDLGWWSGDMHVHRPPEDIEALALAEDLNLSVVFTMWNKRNLWDGKPLPADSVMRFSPHHLATLMNAEDERGGGAWMLHQLPRPLALGVDGRWSPPGIVFVREARAERAPGALFPWFDSEKLIWWEVPVMMALATPDSLGVLHNHFNQYGVRQDEAWGRPRDTGRFPGAAGFAQYTTGLYYRYLNLGFHLPPSAGSATGVLPNPAGYNRMYVRLTAPFNVENWYSALRDGASFVTNGPMLFFDAKPAGKGTAVHLKAQAREPLQRIEIVANGEVIRSFTPQPGAKRWESSFTLDTGKHSWLAARCLLATEGNVRMAHTSPVYLPGKWDASADAQYFVDWIDALIAESAAPKRFANDAGRDAVLALYREARAFYAARAVKH